MKQKPVKYILSFLPKWMIWVIGSVIAALIGLIVVQYVKDEDIVFSTSNTVKLLFGIIVLTLIGFIYAAIKSVNVLLPDGRENVNNGRQYKTGKILLTKSKIVLGEYQETNLHVPLNAKIDLGFHEKPEVSEFLELVEIGKPYCPQCNRDLDFRRASWMADGVQTGYKCKKCGRERDGNEYALLKDAKAEVRKDFENYWQKYQGEIHKLTRGKPENFEVPSAYDIYKS
jgi:ribosomal protein L37AE/L43A